MLIHLRGLVELCVCVYKLSAMASFRKVSGVFHRMLRWQQLKDPSHSKFLRRSHSWCSRGYHKIDSLPVNQIRAASIPLQQKSPRDFSTQADHAIRAKPGHLELRTSSGGTFVLPYFWLRDNCRCEKCYHSVNHQVLHDIAKLDMNIEASDVRQNGDEVKITWPDDHQSSYTMDWLLQHAPHDRNSDREATISARKVLWQGGLIDKIPKISLSNLEEDHHGSLREFWTHMDQYGAIIVEGVGLTPKSLENLVDVLGVGMHSTFYDMGVSVMKAGLDVKDTNWTNVGLSFHTDTSYFQQPCRGVTIHVTKLGESGGQSFLTDGFFIIDKLRRTRPSYFKTLCEVPLPQNFVDDKRNIRENSPVISLNPTTKEVECLRFNQHDRAVLTDCTHQQLIDLYEAYQAFVKEIKKEENIIRFQLYPGQVLVIDNWRILHGRASYTGDREVQGAYIRHDDWMSQLRRYAGLDV